MVVHSNDKTSSVHSHTSLVLVTGHNFDSHSTPSNFFSFFQALNRLNGVAGEPLKLAHQAENEEKILERGREREKGPHTVLVLFTSNFPLPTNLCPYTHIHTWSLLNGLDRSISNNIKSSVQSTLVRFIIKLYIFHINISNVLHTRRPIDFLMPCMAQFLR